MHGGPCGGGVHNGGLRKSAFPRAVLGSPGDLGQVILLSPWAKGNENPLNCGLTLIVSPRFATMIGLSALKVCSVV